MRISLIIAAGGSGTRFKAAARALSAPRGKMKSAAATKLFYPLCGYPLLLWTLKAFQDIPEVKETIVALPAGIEREVKQWIKTYRLRRLYCVRGGKTRAESVRLALQKSSSKQPWVMIHDGARPLVKPDTVRAAALKAERKAWDACLLAKQVVPTIKQSDAGRSQVVKTLDRTHLYEAETPQIFRRSALLKAYQTLPDFKEAPTDEASLMEAAGYCVHLVSHDDWNPKITTLADFNLAESYMKNKETLNTRMGLGSDSHRLIRGRPFWLGGVRLKSDYGPVGHSDGDALLHALIDALFGAAAMGDIGDYFSDLSEKNKNRSSSEMLRQALQLLGRKGWKPAQIDAVVHLETPRLGLIKKQLVKKMAQLLHLAQDAVSIKAKTFEGVGTGGAGLLIRCDVLAVIQRSSHVR